MIWHFDIDTAFTRFDTKTKSYTLIDGILISNELRDMVSDIRILTRDDNLSDHCPVELDTEVVITESLYKKKKNSSATIRKLEKAFRRANCLISRGYGDKFILHTHSILLHSS